MRQAELRIRTLLLCLSVFAAIVPTFAARPDFLQQYLEDPLRSAGEAGCSVCHLDEAGGGPRNAFGEAYAGEGLVITPDMRIAFTDLFDVPTSVIGDRGTLSFADPENGNVVLEIDEERFLIELPAGALGTAPVEVEEVPDRGNFSFFVTSRGLGNGSNLGALAGADRHCQALAESVGSANRTWKAYLSTTFNSAPAVNAGDRIGDGPWFNIQGIRIARGVSDLHSANNRLNAGTVLTELGETASRHDILTGTLVDGTASAMTCENWTSSGEGTAQVGHFDRQGGGQDGTSWNSAHLSQGCSQENLTATGGDGLFYCFAVD